MSFVNPSVAASSALLRQSSAIRMKPIAQADVRSPLEGGSPELVRDGGWTTPPRFAGLPSRRDRRDRTFIAVTVRTDLMRRLKTHSPLVIPTRNEEGSALRVIPRSDSDEGSLATRGMTRRVTPRDLELDSGDEESLRRLRSVGMTGSHPARCAQT